MIKRQLSFSFKLSDAFKSLLQQILRKKVAVKLNFIFL